VRSKGARSIFARFADRDAVPSSEIADDMTIREGAGIFGDTVPKVYASHLAPLIFDPYAMDLAQRVERHAPARILELAAGTGVLTRALADTLPSATEIVATDISPGMLELAVAAGTSRPVEFRKEDAMQLPFGDASFDVVVCQFGVMFFSDKARAYAEARRVLRPGGVFLFSVWDAIQENEFADVVTASLATIFPTDPPRFMARIPHGYHDCPTIAADLASGGFTSVARVETMPVRSRADSPLIPAVAYCQGTPLRNEIVARDATRLVEATGLAAEAIARRFGDGMVDGKIQAHVISATN
jgi:SAM-dependent methyltransferase